MDEYQCTVEEGCPSVPGPLCSGCAKFNISEECDTMGYMVHHAIIVTSEFRDKIMEAHVYAQTVFTEVSPIIQASVNIAGSFFVPPDGSKEGWVASDEGDSKREKFVEYLRAQENLSWVEVQFGDDDGDNKIIHSDADYLGPHEPPQPVSRKHYPRQRRMIDLG